VNNAAPPPQIDTALPAPEIAPSPQQSQAEPAPGQESGAAPGAETAPQPAASPEGAWQQVASFSGNSTKTTPMFTVGPEWKIQWSTEPGESSHSSFLITIFDANGEFVGIAANVSGASADESYQYQAGTYYLTFNSDQSYRVGVWEKR
jgi:hypothetical protein